MHTNVLLQIQQDLLQARRNRDQLKVDALQSLLTRITNAEAVPVAGHHNGAAGVGSTEVQRRTLSDADVQNLIQQEINELSEAYAGMSGHHDHPYAQELAGKRAIIQRYKV